MKKENINFLITQIDINTGCKILQHTILGLTLNNIRYGYGTLVFEFGILDKKGFKGEYSIVCESDWKFQYGYEIKYSSKMEKSTINSFLVQYVGKKLKHCCFIEKTGEIFLDFGEVFFTTLSTYDISLGWSLYFNCEANGNYKSHIDSDETGIYHTTIKK